MKKTIILATVFLFSTLAFATGPTPKMLAAFQTTFEGTSAVKWYDVEDGCCASFYKDSIQYRVTYNEQGAITSSIRYYGAQQLPFLIRAKVLSRYSGKNIYGIIEVTVEEETRYRIILEDATKWFVLHSDVYGNAFVVEKYNRALIGNDLAKQEPKS